MKRMLVSTVMGAAVLWAALAMTEARAQEAQPAAGQEERAKLVFRPLTEERGGKSLLEANEILASKIVVLVFRDAELQDVLRLIAAKSNLNIILNPAQVVGKVTLHLENVRLGVALDQILRINNLAFVVEAEENIVRIVDASSVGRKVVETKTEVLQANWVSASSLAQTLGSFAKAADGESIVVNSETNSLIVTATPPNLEIMRQLMN